MKSFTFSSSIWLYPGSAAAWYFISLPKDVAAVIKSAQALLSKQHRRGWGAVRVGVTIGKTKWETSVFPDKKSETYLLPIKASVRKKEGLMERDVVTVKIAMVNCG